MQSSYNFKSGSTPKMFLFHIPELTILPGKCSQIKIFLRRPHPCGARLKFLASKLAFFKRFSKSRISQTKRPTIVKNGFQMSFAPKNLLPKGILLHTIFYKIQLVRPIYLLNRPKVVLPPLLDQKFLRVPNLCDIGKII